MLDNVRHDLKASADGSTLDVRALAGRLIETLGQFEQVYGEGGLRLGGGLGTRLGGDTRDEVQRLLRLLRGLRLAAYAAANRDADGDPEKAVASDPVADYWPEGVASPVVFSLRHRLWRQLDPARRRVNSAARGHVFVHAPHFTNTMNNDVMQGTKDTLVNHDAEAVRLEASISEHVGDADPREFAEAFRVWWLYETDAGLLWRLRVEAEGLVEEYRPFLRGQTLPTPTAPVLLGVSADVTD